MGSSWYKKGEWVSGKRSVELRGVIDAIKGDECLDAYKLAFLNITTAAVIILSNVAKP